MGIKNCKERLMDVYRKVLVCAHEASGWSQQRVNHLKNAARWRLKSLVGKMLREDVGRMVDNLYLCGK